MQGQIKIKTDWINAFDDSKFKKMLEASILPAYLNTCRWFAGKARKQESVQIDNLIKLPVYESVAFVLILKVNYSEGNPENYFLPISFIDSDKSNSKEILPKGIISLAYCHEKRGLIVDSIYDEDFQQTLFKNLSNNNITTQNTNKIVFNRGKGLAGEDINSNITSRVLNVEQSNSSIVYGEKYFLKLYRKLFSETNPEVEMVAFLTENSDFPYIPAFAGNIAWQRKGKPEVTLGMMQRMVENQTDAWTVTGDLLTTFMEAFSKKEFLINESIFDKVELLAKRTAEMHLALFAPNANKEFSPAKFDNTYKKFIHDRIKNLLDNRYDLIIENYTKLEPEAQKLAWDFMEAKELIDDFIDQIITREIFSQRIRIHGDYHLGQVLATETDYIIIDFEGEPESSITDRKIKHSPLKDVAGIIRSYHYAISSKFFNDSAAKDTEKERSSKASDRWYGLIQKTFLEKYFSTFGKPHPLFKNNTEINFLLLVYLLEKAVYELGYEVSYRPDWVKIPLKGIVDVIREIEKLKT
jgi:trehalose synthase-fused probable maltokinase